MNIEVLGNLSRKLRKTLCFLVSGKAGVGKTYNSAIIKNVAIMDGLNAEVFNFARSVKETAKFMGWNGEKDSAGRTLLQDIGRIGRKYDENLWVDDTMRRIEDSYNYPYDVVIIDDWRFPNEFTRIKENNPLYFPITVRIISPSRAYKMDSSQMEDVSETSLDSFKFDYEVVNEDRSLQDLEKIWFDILTKEAMNNS